MIGCLRTRVRKQPIIALYFESETVFKFYNLEARLKDQRGLILTLKAPITTAADDKYCDFFPDFRKK